MTGPRNDPQAEWASVVPPGEFPEDLHGNIRGKCYAFKRDGRCPECLVEACERQQAGGFGAGLPRGLLARSLVYERPYADFGGSVTATFSGSVTATLDTRRPYTWTVEVRLHGV